jgi:hypothetical protein
MVTAETTFGGYAESIIIYPNEYDQLEIHGVSEEPDGYGGTACEINDENPEFYSVYAHLKEGGVECIGDFRTPADAMAYASGYSVRYGWPIESHHHMPH